MEVYMSNTKSKSRSNFIRLLPIIVSSALILLGIALNIPLLKVTEDQLSIFIIGNITPNIMVKTLYIMWTMGAIGLPLSIYYVFFNEKKVPLIITMIACIILLPICMYLGAVDEANVVGSDVTGYEIYTDGTHKLVVKLMNSGGTSDYQSFYIQDSKYHCTWKNSGTVDAPIVWYNDHVAVLVYDKEMFSYSLDEFYDN